LLNSFYYDLIFFSILRGQSIDKTLLENISDDRSLVVRFNQDVTLRAFDGRVSPFETPYIVEDANLAESMTTVNNSMSESK
jgi:hypothetical protein